MDHSLYRLLPRILSAFAILAISAQWATGTPARPNIILIMSDDMGYSDLGSYGGEIATPNLDQLAAGGLRFTQFYNTGRCCPTRASLLTGLYAHQAGVGRMTSDDGQPGYRGDLSRNAVTLAEVMKSTGYRTYMSGKWHVTTQLAPDGDKSNWPLQRGFDQFYGTIIGAGSFYDPWTLTRDNTAITPENDETYQPREYYYTDAISDNAVQFIRDHGTRAEPFFLYLSYTAPHWPLHALERDVAKYKGKYDAGYEAIRQARHERMKKLGVIRNAELSPGPQAWEEIPAEKRAWEARCMEVYAAMVDNMDQGIGRVVQALRDNGRYDNTLILYLHDNGACSEARGRRPLVDPVKPSAPMGRDELQTQMEPTHTRAGEPVLNGPGVMPGPATTYIAYGWNWANVSNTPLREHKSKAHEGGIATPLIAHWPRGIVDRGALRDQPGHLIDIMATCVEISGATYPKIYQKNEIQPMEGRSLVTTFAGQPATERLLLWEHYGKAAIRKGNWKLVRGLPQGDWELYDIAEDRSEMHNLAQDRPDLAKELAELWEKEAHRTKIYPLPKSFR